ncbi:MAG: rhodanese-like domain-containing protein [Verrucomicrobiota bacterium]
MKILLLVLAALAVLMVVQRLLAGSVIKPAEVVQRLAGGQAVLIDVREPAEWAATGVAAPAVLLSLSDLQGPRTRWKPFLDQNRGKTLLLYCRSGNRSGLAARILAQEGWTTVNAGSFQNWAGAGQPVRAVPDR